MIARRPVSALAVLLVAVAGLAAAGTAVASPESACTARRGSTLLENGYARVFRHRGDVYACALAGTAVSTLRDAADITLAGKYVAWERVQVRGVEEDLNVLNTATGRYVTVGDMQYGGHYIVEVIDGYVMNAHGTIVWLFDSTFCQPTGPGCSTTGYVLEHSSRGRKTIATATRSGGRYPVSGLGLSADGRLAYWLQNGQPAAAALS